MTIKNVGQALGLFAAFLACGAVNAQPLTVSHGYPPNHTIAEQGIHPWMECVATGTGDAITFNYYPGGQIASLKDSFDAINGGVSHVSTVVIPYLSHLLPLNGLSMLPDMGDTSADMVKAYRQMLSDEGPMFEEWRAIGVRPLVINMLPVFQLVSNASPVDALEKFKGKTVRSAGGLLNFTIGALGATPVEMAAGDMYVAMQRGTIDGAFSALASIKPYSLHELAGAISTNGKFGGGATIIGISQGAWERMPKEHQQVVDECGAAVELRLADYLDTENLELQEEFRSSGIKVYEFSAEENLRISAYLTRVSEAYIARLERRGIPGQAVYTEYRKKIPSE